MDTPTDPSQDVPSSSADSQAKVQSANHAASTSPLIYVLAVLFGLFSGWVNERVNDALLTSLCVLCCTMLLGVCKKDRPWRWLLLVWAGVPLVLAYYQFIVHWPHDRSQWWAAFLQILAASAGANGGHYMRDMIDHVFLKKDE